MSKIITLILIFAICGCNIGQTFDEISSPYIDKYGTPEDESIYNSSGYHTIDWWWYSKGFNVTFMNEKTGDRNSYGWIVLNEYSF